MNDERIKVLRDLDTKLAIIKLSIPAIIGFLVMAIYNMVDTIFVSWIDYKGAGAVQVAYPIMMIGGAIGLAFGIGGGSYISRLLGEHKIKKANAVIILSFCTSIVVGLLYVAVVLYFLNPILKAFGAEKDMMVFARDYAYYIVIGTIFIIPSMVFNNSLRAEGSSKYSMIGMAVGSIINIILDPLFIFTFDMGIKGAAIATMISQIISLFILVQYYLRKKTILQLSLSNLKIDCKIYAEILKIGVPTFFRQILFSISMAVLNKSAAIVGGDYLLSAVGISLKVTAVPTYIIFGLGQGIQPVVGYNFGANNLNRVRSAERHGLKISFGITFINTIILLVYAKPILHLFTDEIHVYTYGIFALRALSISLIFMAVSNTIAIIFQAIGHKRVSLLFSVLRQGILFIPAILILSAVFGEKGLLLSQLIADILTFFISMVIYIRFIRKNEIDF